MTTNCEATVFLLFNFSGIQIFLVGHHNDLISAMSIPPTYASRLKRQWMSDLFHPQVAA